MVLPLSQGSASGVRAPTCLGKAGAAGSGADGLAGPLGHHGELAGVVAGSGRLVRVWAANAGAGASTIALALADAADAADLHTRVLDAATPAWSGLAGAAVTELGAAQGWRRGRRGHEVLIDRVDVRVAAPDLVPAPRAADGIHLTVLDTGWTVRELATASAGPGKCWVAGAPADVEVVVTRATTPALGQAEEVLLELTDRPVIAVVVGPARMSRQLVTLAGPRLRRLHHDQGVMCLTRLAAGSMAGLGTEPLPRQLIGAGRRLLDRITTVTGPLDRHQS